MINKPILVGAWLTVAVVLACVGVLDILRWRGDPEFAQLGLIWTDSYLPHAIVAAIAGIACLSANRMGLRVAIVASSLFGLYFAAYLIFGGEGTILLRLAIPLVLLALVIFTIRFALSALRAQEAALPKA